ncbi:RING finger protein 10, partial [Clydaea vesicula]
MHHKNKSSNSSNKAGTHSKTKLNSRNETLKDVRINNNVIEEIRSSKRINSKGDASLLDFNIPPRLNGQTHKKKNGSSASVNKERFVNANYRFVVSDENTDYALNLIDPDLAVDWNKVIQVIMPTSDIITCPICLHPPTAAKVTKCGHVYCWHCMSHYLNDMNERSLKKSTKCPICYETVEANHLRSVRILFTKDINISKNNTIDSGEAIEKVKLKMSLMKRHNGSITALPRSTYNSWAKKTDSVFSTQNVPPCIKDPNALTFSKLLLCSKEYLREEILMRDKLELEQVLSDIAISNLNENSVPSTTEVKFVNYCLNLNNSKLTELNFICKEKWQVTPHLECNNKSDNLQSKLDYKEEHTVEKPQQFTIESNLKLEIKKKKLVEPYFYFYQSSDGQNLFLHPLDIRILLHQYGDYSKFPERLDVDITHLSESTLNQGLRKKFKYLGHVPLGCDIGFVEVDWQTFELHKDTIKLFSKEILKRKKRHLEKEISEKKFQERQNKRNELVAQQVEIENKENFFSSQRFIGEDSDLSSYGENENLFPPMGVASAAAESGVWSGASFGMEIKKFLYKRCSIKYKARITGTGSRFKNIQKGGSFRGSGVRFNVLNNETIVVDCPKKDVDDKDVFSEVVYEQSLNPLFKKEWTLDIGDLDEKQDEALVNELINLDLKERKAAQKFHRQCKNLGGDFHSALNKTDLLFLTYSDGKKAPVSPNAYICLSKKHNETSNLSDLYLPIPGTPPAYLEDGNIDSFKTDCIKACGNGVDFRFGAISLRQQTLGVCTCVGSWPTAPKLNKKSLAISVEPSDGFISGLQAPLSPHTYQTCAEFSQKFPTQGLGNMACPCKEFDYPYPDMGSCKWAGESQVVPVPGAPAVWQSLENYTPILGCPAAQKSCNAACGVTSGEFLASNVACFNFMSLTTIQMMCQCKDGKFPTAVNGFKLMSAMDANTGLVPGTSSSYANNP